MISCLWFLDQAIAFGLLFLTSFLIVVSRSPAYNPPLVLGSDIRQLLLIRYFLSSCELQFLCASLGVLLMAMATQFLASTASTAMNFCMSCPPATASSSSTISAQFSRTNCCMIIPAKFPRVQITARPRRRMASGIRAVQQAFFESSVVQAESERLQADYSYLLNLGRKYGKFDREGKVFYIKEMKQLIERWQIFVKRMELVDDVAAKSAVNELRSEVGPLGLSSMDLADSIYIVLDEMRKDAEAEAEAAVS